ncbi:hypothetical protein N866_11175 [Actinotalea ferrariae CF5-4]|uniref:Uncharacterized protein n=1 Tax=Actinotalea ferrariae CF5-4 TaxID=948458 RepID=A0A021VLW2_9CELL|nr:hypothetical protein N866_11175 [Actinotalea ferrariae CF5-4]
MMSGSLLVRPAGAAVAAAMTFAPQAIVTTETSRRVEHLSMSTSDEVWFALPVTSTTREVVTVVDGTVTDRAHLADDNAYWQGVRAAVSSLWADDWDSPEDSVYDTW